MNCEKKKSQASPYESIASTRATSMLQSYVRDPNELFFQPQPCGSLAKKFNNVSFISEPDVILHTVCVDWYTSTAKVYADSSDVMNNIPSRQIELPFRASATTAEECVRETFQFLMRGHSLHHQSCRCLCKWRRSSDDYCSVSTTGQGRSVKDVERELGVRSLYGLVAAGGETLPLIQVLVRLAGMTLYNNNYISSHICCVPPEVKSAEDILSAARALYPRPYISTETSMGDLARLESKGCVRLIVLSGAQSLEREYAVFWRDNKQWQQKAVDADIQKLWATVPHIAISQKHSISPKTTKKSNGKLPFKKKRKLAPLLKVK
jgi:hypothetical protein